MLKIPTHDDCVATMKVYLDEREIKWIDLEKEGSYDHKHPDLLLPDENLVLEVKTIQPNDDEINGHKNIEKNILSGKIVTYWHPEKYNSISEDISNCRQKFRNYPKYKTAVVVFDLMPHFFRQESYKILEGQDQIIVKTFTGGTDDEKQIYYTQKTNKPLHRQNSANIGAILWHYNRNAFKIYHNELANSFKRIPLNLFSRKDDVHFFVSISGEIKKI